MLVKLGWNWVSKKTIGDIRRGVRFQLDRKNSVMLGWNSMRLGSKYRSQRKVSFFRNSCIIVKCRSFRVLTKALFPSISQGCLWLMWTECPAVFCIHCQAKTVAGILATCLSAFFDNIHVFKHCLARIYDILRVEGKCLPSHSYKY